MDRWLWNICTFQYQKGAIKTAEARLTPNTKRRFQYQKGAIKTEPHIGYHRPLDPGFQYQKGAIKTILFQPLLSNPSAFQYQKGAIKTGARGMSPVRSADDFNTKKVRLKPTYKVSKTR